MDINDIKKAQKIIQPHITKTPLKKSKFFSKLCKGNVFLKLENQQITNSFKIRGALNKMLQLSTKEKQKGVVTASAGNHGQAVGVGAEKLSLKAIIFVPKTTPQKKIDKISICEAKLHICGKNFKETENLAISYAKNNNMTYISPYNDELVIAGQGTLALEILQDIPKIDTFLVPVGGGGLISGIAFAAKNTKSNVEVIGVQSKASPVMFESLKAGKIIELPIKKSIADGISGGVRKTSITFTFTQKYVDTIITVKENTIKQAIKLLWETEKQITEGAGAVGLAAIIENKNQFRNKNTAVIITGANIDDKIFQKIIRN